MREANPTMFKSSHSRVHPNNPSTTSVKPGQGSFVAVCIWLPRNEKGEFTDAATVAHEVQNKGSENAVVGHASLLIYDPQDGVHEYVSFWPNNGRSLLRAYSRTEFPVGDRQAEGRPPDAVVRLFTLNVLPMVELLERFKQRLPRWTLQTVLPSQGEEDNPDAPLSCATFAWKLLLAGGIVKNYNGHGMPVRSGPKDKVLRQRFHCDEGAILKGLFDPMPWRDWIASPKLILHYVTSAYELEGRSYQQRNKWERNAEKIPMEKNGKPIFEEPRARSAAKNQNYQVHEIADFFNNNAVNLDHAHFWDAGQIRKLRAEMWVGDFIVEKTQTHAVVRVMDYYQEQLRIPYIQLAIGNQISYRLHANEKYIVFNYNIHIKHPASSKKNRSVTGVEIWDVQNKTKCWESRDQTFLHVNIYNDKLLVMKGEHNSKLAEISVYELSTGILLKSFHLTDIYYGSQYTWPIVGNCIEFNYHPKSSPAELAIKKFDLDTLQQMPSVKKMSKAEIEKDRIAKHQAYENSVKERTLDMSEDINIRITPGFTGTGSFHTAGILDVVEKRTSRVIQSVKLEDFFLADKTFFVAVGTINIQEGWLILVGRPTRQSESGQEFRVVTFEARAPQLLHGRPSTNFVPEMFRQQPFRPQQPRIAVPNNVAALFGILNQLDHHNRQYNGAHVVDEWANNDGIRMQLTRWLALDGGEPLAHIILPINQSLYNDHTTDEARRNAAAYYGEVIAGARRANGEIQSNSFIHRDSNNNNITNANPNFFLRRPVVMILNTQSVHALHAQDAEREGGTHWVCVVILPRQYRPPHGVPLNNNHEIVYHIDSLNEGAQIPAVLRNILLQGGNHQIRQENDDVVNHQVFPVCPLAVFHNLTPAQQLGGSDCGPWAFYNSLMLVFTGRADYLQQFNQRRRAGALRDLFDLTPVPRANYGPH